MSCAVFSGELPLIDLKGKALISADSHQIRVNDVDLKILLKNLDLPELRRNFPEVDASGLQRLDDGAVRVQLAELDLDQQNLKNLKASVSLMDLAVQLKQLPSPIKINAKLQASQSDVEVSQFTVGIKEGSISGQAKLIDYTGKQNYSAELNFAGVQAAELVDFSAMDMKVRARLDGNMTVQGQGFEATFLENFLRGQAKLQISAGSVLSTGDPSTGRPLDMSFKQINLNVADFGLNRFFPFLLTGIVFSDNQQVIDLKGQASIQTAGQQVRMQEGELKIYLKKLDMAQLQRTVPELAQSGLERLDDGELRVQLSDLILDSKGLQKFKAAGELLDVSLKVKQIPSAVRISSHVKADQNDAELSGLTVLIKEGAIKGRAAVRDYIGKQDF
ncbi:MAG: AsmA family protein, partial [Candidatus Omnitrophica bacterium]|nr:AsmA family protein [Candidatus Omnitrophota bacterium]